MKSHDTISFESTRLRARADCRKIQLEHTIRKLMFVEALRGYSQASIETFSGTLESLQKSLNLRVSRPWNRYSQSSGLFTLSRLFIVIRSGYYRVFDSQDSGSTLLPESMLSGAQKGSILRKITRGNSKASILAPKSFNRSLRIPSSVGTPRFLLAHS